MRPGRSKMRPCTSKMRPWSSKRYLLSPGIDFGRFLVDFWEAFGLHFEVLGSFWAPGDAKGSPQGTQREPREPQGRPKGSPGTSFQGKVGSLKKCVFHWF